MHSCHITLSEVHGFTMLMVVTFLPSTCLDMVIFVRRGIGDMKLSSITRLSRSFRSSDASRCGSGSG